MNPITDYLDFIIILLKFDTLLMMTNEYLLVKKKQRNKISS